MEGKKTGKKEGKLAPVAKALYVSGDLKQKEIAEQLGVSENTISKWAAKGGWEAERTRNRNSPSQLISWLYSEIEKVRTGIGENPMGSKEAHVIKMLSSTIKELDKKIDPVVVIDVFKGFTGWLKTVDLDLAKSIIDRQHQYVMTLVNEGQE